MSSDPKTFGDPVDPAVAPAPAQATEPNPNAPAVPGSDAPPGAGSPSNASVADHAPVPHERSADPKDRKVAKKSREKIIPDTLTLQPVPRRPGSTSARTMLRSALLVIGLPTCAAIAYFGFLASAQYAAMGNFIIKTSYGSTINPAASMAFGMPPTSHITDSLAVNEYLLSPQIISDIEPLLDLRAMYGNSSIDWFARLKPSWGEETITNERLLDYWRHMVGVYFDVTTGITSVEVKAFTAEDAQKIAATALDLSEQLVNRLSERAKEDSLAFARQEVETFRQQAMSAMDAMQDFQEKAKQVDPTGFAAARNKLQAELEGQTTQLQAQLAILRHTLPENAPAVVQVARRLEVVEGQLAQEMTESTISETGESAATVLNQFNKLKLENEFAKDAYMDSLKLLETARADAQKQGLFLESFVRPQLPQTAQYPQRALSVFLVFIGSVIVWGLGGLFVATAREHL